MPCCNASIYKRLQRLLSCPCSYTIHATKQRTGIYRCVSGNLTHSTAYNTRPAKADITPPAPRWSTSQRCSTSSAYQIPDAAPDAIQVIIRYIRVQHTANHASPAGSAPTVCGSLASAAPGAPAEGSAPPPVPGQPGGGLDTSHAWLNPWRRISQALARHTSGIMFSSWHGRRGTTGGYRRISFRAFAR